MVFEVKPSAQWERILENWVTEDAAADLSNFKSDTRNYNLALWNPEVNGVRYFKTLVYNVASELDPEEWTRLRNIRNREIGNPITVRVNGESVCLDYAQAVLELGFIQRHLDLQGARVMEIGAGYGRTCHAMLSNYDLAEYWIVDLTNTLRLSRAYLREVLDDAQYAKVRFVDVADLDQVIQAPGFELCINIHSMTEMVPQTVRDYLGLIDKKCTAFYVKNPVGKFLDKQLDGHHKGSEAVQAALQSGPIRNVLDIFDSEAIEAAVPGYLSVYLPGDNWSCVADARAYPLSYFWQGLYLKTPQSPAS
jgi:putative sugar O-methyltransferase